MVTRGSGERIRPEGHSDECRREENMLFEIDFERFIEENLDFRELLVSQMRVSGYSVVEIAKYQGVSRRCITRVVTNLREKFRKFLALME